MDKPGRASDENVAEVLEVHAAKLAGVEDALRFIAGDCGEAANVVALMADVVAEANAAISSIAMKVAMTSRIEEEHYG